MTQFNRPLFTECDELVLVLHGEHEFVVLCGMCVDEILTLWPLVEMRSTFNDAHGERCERCGVLSRKGAHFEGAQFHRQRDELQRVARSPDDRDFDTITDEHVAHRGKQSYQ